MAVNISGVTRDNNGRYIYKGQVVGGAMGANEDAIRANMASIDENEARATTKQQGVDLSNQQQSQASDFRANIPKYTGLLQDQAKKTIQRNLAENINTLKQNSASRGFLKGSGTQRQQAEAQAQASSDIASKDSEIADTLELQAQQFENNALATKMSMQGSANQATIDALRQSILDNQRQTELWKSLGNVAGTSAGAYLASKSKGGAT